LTSVTQTYSCTNGSAAALGNPVSSTASNGSPTCSPASAACEKFHPGHYLRVTDSSATDNGIKNLTYHFTNEDLSNFAGVVYQTRWGAIESTPGTYDFTRLDQAVALAAQHKKYMQIIVMDRTFGAGCSSDFIPAYVSRQQHSTDPGSCFAKTWEKDTMDRYIAVLSAVARRYQDNPYFIGLHDEETAVGAIDLANNQALALTEYEQLKRLATEVQAAAPRSTFTQYFNWPQYGDLKLFKAMADNLVATGRGGLGWPDSMVAEQYNWSWYQLARDYHAKLLVAPSVEWMPTRTVLSESINDHEAVYQMLTKDMHAHMIVWSTWASFPSDYVAQVIVPVVGAHKDADQINKVCPFLK
jgi:hypothetical protein